MEPPPGYVLESRRNWGLAISGAVILVGSYVAGLSFAGGDTRGGGGSMAVPVIGPWLTLGSRNFQCELDLTLESAQRCQVEATRESNLVALYAGVGVLELLGTSLFLIGLFDRDDSWVRKDLVVGRNRALSIEPVIGHTRAGFQMALTF